jgi:hypothetical protein
MDQLSIASPAITPHNLMSSFPAMGLSPTGRTLVPHAQYPVSPAYSSIPLTFGGQFSPGHAAIGYQVPTYFGNPFGAGGQYPQMSQYNGSSSLARSTLNSAQFGGRFDERFDRSRRAPSRNGSRAGYGTNQSGQHNVVEIAKIRDGIDVRTTVSHFLLHVLEYR